MDAPEEVEADEGKEPVPTGVDPHEGSEPSPSRKSSANLGGGLASGIEPQSAGRSWDEVKADISGPVSEAELAAAIEETRKNSAVADYYPRRNRRW